MAEKLPLQWFDPKDVQPADGQECLLMPLDYDGKTTFGVYGPIAWTAKNSVWMDPLSDPEERSFVKPEHVAKWCDWMSIAPDA